MFTDSRGNHIEKPAEAPVSWRVSAYAIARYNDTVLMVQSSDGHWIFPGGGIEDNETIAEAITRECAEETGYSVRIIGDAPFYVREQPFYHSRDQQFYHSLQLFYEAVPETTTPDTSLITEHDKSRRSEWVTINQLSTEALHHTIRDLTDKLLALAR